MEKRPFNPRWLVVTPKRQILWHRADDDEVWALRPPNRYVVNAEQLPAIEDNLEVISDMSGMSHYRPLSGRVNLAKAKILVERVRDRGIGDLLFLTGPLSYLHHLSGGSCQIFAHALSDRGSVLNGHPSLYEQTAYYGPLEYDQMANYSYHWLIDSVTEYNQEVDQLNVYDALYTQLGLDPKDVSPRFKRPTAYVSVDDRKNLESLFYFIYKDHKLDLRKDKGYYVVAPLSVSVTRSANYEFWLKTIEALSKRRPVVVIGKVRHIIPSTDMEFGTFYQHLSKLGPNVINLMGDTPLRLTMAIIANSAALVCLDSGPLYMAQALRVPAVSVWGTHNPGVRLGYDQTYMDLAIWNSIACRSCPCFTYSGFPTNRCPQGDFQKVCSVLSSVSHNDVMEKIEKVESTLMSDIGTFKAANE